MRQPARICSLAADGLVLELPARWDALHPGVRCVIRLHQPEGSFDVNAKIASRMSTPRPGAVWVALSAEFTPELVDIVDRFFFRRSLEGLETSA